MKTRARRTQGLRRPKLLKAKGKEEPEWAEEEAVEEVVEETTTEATEEATEEEWTEEPSDD